KLPANGAAIRSIVTSPFCDYICKKYGVKMHECLTGFKWIAAVEDDFEKDNSETYVYGLEESYGYKVEKEVMDKDGVSAAAMCAEMTLYWASKGKSILEHLDDMYKEFGFFEDRAISQNFPGSAGKEVMAGIMTKLRTEGLKSLGGKKVVCIKDIGNSVAYDPENPSAKTEIKLPKSNVLQFVLEGGTIVSARPSGTEPKIKFYINARTDAGAGLEKAKAESGKVCDAITAEIKKVLENA
ncbi:MAG: phospho-sugar mutase, partial [Treponema sp.]|nr:phospho-sugar mutase [Treponema sp.]